MTKEHLIEKLNGREITWMPVNDERPAAVLIPIIENDDRFEVVLEIRAPKLKQAGEVCLPGGSIEDGETSEQAAIRETCEELEIDPSQIEMIAPMISTAGPGGRMVETYLAFLHDYHGTYSRKEVDHVLTVPLRFFYVAEPIIGDVDLYTKLRDNFPLQLLGDKKDFEFQPVKRSYEFYETKGHVIWGLTSNILKRVAEIVYGDEYSTRND